MRNVIELFADPSRDIMTRSTEIQIHIFYDKVTQMTSPYDNVFDFLVTR